MKLRRNEKYATIALYVFFTAAAVALLILLLVNLGGVFSALKWVAVILSPFIWAAALAYLFNRPVILLEKKVFFRLKKEKPRKLLAIAVVYLLVAGMLTGVICVIIPQLIENAVMLIRKLPAYYDELSLVLSSAFDGIFSFPQVDWDTFNASVLEYLSPLYGRLTTMGIEFTVKFVGGVISAFIAVMGSFYILISKDKFIQQFKKMLYAMFPNRFTGKIIRVARETDLVLSAFIFSKLVASLVVGVFTFLSLLAANIPYALLIGALMGIFNLLPFFGPIIGAIPCGMLLLVVKPVYALVFLVITIVLQFVDGQIITPKMVGDAVGISPFWVLFAVIVFGGMAGVPGMILGVPVFSVIYTLIKEFTDHRLKKKGLSTLSQDYQSDKKGRR